MTTMAAAPVAPVVRVAREAEHEEEEASPSVRSTVHVRANLARAKQGARDGLVPVRAVAVTVVPPSPPPAGYVRSHSSAEWVPERVPESPLALALRGATADTAEEVQGGLRCGTEDEDERRRAWRAEGLAWRSKAEVRQSNQSRLQYDEDEQSERALRF